ITKHKNPRELYLDQLLASGKIEAALANEMIDSYKQLLSDRFNNVRQKEIPSKKKGPHKDWEGINYSNENSFNESPATGVKKEILDKVVKAVNSTPSGFQTIKKSQKVLDDREQAYKTDKLDWASAELLAYGSLLGEGKHLRFTGQD